jgi:hypothetical protein
MHVVGHQAIGVQGNITLARILTQPVEIKAAIVIGKEHRLTIHATLNDVLRNTG